MQDAARAGPTDQGVRLSRNFGHQIALTAGLDHALGQAVIMMDADLQDPPEVALELARRWREGYEVVYAVRDERDGESRLKLATARWFYRVMGRMSEVPIPVDAGDFRLVDRRAVDAVASMREHSRYLRGMFAWVGYDQTGVRYPVGPLRRPHEVSPPEDAVVRDRRHRVVLGRPAAARARARLHQFGRSRCSPGWSPIVCRLTGVYEVPGWASILVAVSFLGGVQLTVLGVMGLYIARIYDEVKQRPLYLVRDRVGDGAARRRRAVRRSVVRRRSTKRLDR